MTVHVETIVTGSGRRIERIGSDAQLPGIRRIEWHEAPTPDGEFLRLPLADIVCTVNLGVVGRYRMSGTRRWQAFPRVALRGIASAPSEGRDPRRGAIRYASIVVAPWALPMYTGLSGGPLANRIICLADAASAWRALGDRLPAASDGDQALQAVSDALARMVSAASWSPRVAQVLDDLVADTPIADAASRAALSPRRVHQLCVAHTGHSPSSYRQIARFGRLTQALHAGGASTSWSAHVRDYADHSHAIREFRRLARMTPRMYAASRPALMRTFSIAPIASVAGCTKPAGF